MGSEGPFLRIIILRSHSFSFTQRGILIEFSIISTRYNTIRPARVHDRNIAPSIVGKFKPEFRNFVWNEEVRSQKTLFHSRLYRQKPEIVEIKMSMVSDLRTFEIMNTDPLYIMCFDFTAHEKTDEEHSRELVDT